MKKTFLFLSAALILVLAANPSFAQLPTTFACDSTTYTPVSGSPGPSGDDMTITVPIGFTFNYAGADYTQMSICTNGWIKPGSTTLATYSNQLCGTSPAGVICGFWDDLNTSNGGNIQYTTQGSSPNRIFIVQYTDVAYFFGSGTVTFQVRCYETSNVIEFIYGTATPNGAATGSVGLSDQTSGPGHVISVTPGANCSSTTYSTQSCNDNVPYTYPNLNPGRRYRFSLIPAAPVLRYPQNHRTGVELTPWLVWNPSTGATSYRVQVATDTSFSTTMLDSTGPLTNDSLHVPSGILTGLTLYYWHVKGINNVGQGPYSATWDFTTGPSGITKNGEVPKEYKLYNNYPNPFNPITTINFDLPKPTDLKIVIFNSIGQEIQILANGRYEAGSYTVQWDASSLPSGLYFFKLESVNFTEVKKMMLVK